MNDEWLIVLNADGTLLATNGEALAAWIGQRLEERSDVPSEVRKAATEAHAKLVRSDRTLEAASAVTPAARVVALRAVPVRPMVVDTRALLESTVQLMRTQARAVDVALTLEIADNVPRTLRVDPQKIAWAITTLVGNALRFVRRGTRLMPGGSIRVRVGHDVAAGHVAIEVQDDGDGIPAEKVAEILDRASGGSPSLGLSLNLIEDVVAAHGGSLQLDSTTEPDRSGTTVRLLVPAV